MEYKEIRNSNFRDFGKAIATGLVGLVLTMGIMDRIDTPKNAEAVGVVGLYLSCLAMGGQLIRRNPEDYYLVK